MDFKIAVENIDLNRSLYQVTHGLYIITTAFEGVLNGQCFDALMQVTNLPPRIAISIGKKSYTSELIVKSGVFVANVFDRSKSNIMEMVRHFGMQSGRKVKKFKEIDYELGNLGVPILPDSKAFFECKLVPSLTLDMDTHFLHVASVVRAGVKDEGEPFTYNEYRKIKFGKGG